jgi:Holliday junction resolvase
MRTRYEIGRAFEYRVKRFLVERGYFVVRSAGSRTPVDLVAFDQSGVLLVQCTTNELCKDEGDRAALLAITVNPHAIPVMVWKRGIGGPLVFERLDGGAMPWETGDEVRQA